jgi:hypothetical protein
MSGALTVTARTALGELLISACYPVDLELVSLTCETITQRLDCLKLDDFTSECQNQN